MKKILTFIWLFIPCLYSVGQPLYQFSSDSPIVYSFSIKGDIKYQYGDAPSEKFNVSSEGTITLKTISTKENTSVVKIIPSRTIIKLNDMVLEDITDIETAVSQVISTSIIEIKPDGRIIHSKEISPGILNISQLFNLLPAFPEKVTAPWKQNIPAFSIPGIPMCALSFNYSYSQGKEGISRVKIFSSQPIKEERKEEDVVIVFTGRNNSNGEFVFDEKRGEIRDFEGVIDLIMNITFKVPPSPEQKVSTKQSIPLRINIKLNIKIEKQV